MITSPSSDSDCILAFLVDSSISRVYQQRIIFSRSSLIVCTASAFIYSLYLFISFFLRLLFGSLLFLCHFFLIPRKKSSLQHTHRERTITPCAWIQQQQQQQQMCEQYFNNFIVLFIFLLLYFVYRGGVIVARKLLYVHFLAKSSQFYKTRQQVVCTGSSFHAKYTEAQEKKTASEEW